MSKMETPADLGSTGASENAHATELSESERNSDTLDASSAREPLIAEQEPVEVYFGDGRVVFERPSRDWESQTGFREIDITIDVAYLPKLLDRLHAIAREAGLEPEPSRSSSAKRSRAWRARRRERISDTASSVSRDAPERVAERRANGRAH